MSNPHFHPDARDEYESAIAWYSDRGRDLDELFVESMDEILDVIGTSPDRYGWYDDDFRQAILTRFPYHVIYRVRGDGRVEVIAVAHASREPGYWRSRVSG